MSNNINDVIIVTGTLYDMRNESGHLRANLGLDSIRAATDIGYKVLLVDNGSTPEFVERAVSEGAVVKRVEKYSMGAQRRLALEEALKTDKQVMAWVDLEKFDYISKIHLTTEPISDGMADMVIPKRVNMDSYPVSQYYTESFMNEFWRVITGTSLDVTFGPRSFNREATQYYLDYKGEYGDKWDFLYIPVINAIVDGKKVISVDVDYEHPAAQTALENSDNSFYRKRVFQIGFLMDSIEPHWNKIHGKN